MGFLNFKHKVKEIEKNVAQHHEQASQGNSVPNMPASPVETQPNTPSPQPEMFQSSGSSLGDAHEPFSLPDLPPISQDTTSTPSLDPVEPVIPDSMPAYMDNDSFPVSHAEEELPSLPDLPSFENHPEIADIEELPDFESIPTEATVPANMQADSDEMIPSTQADELESEFEAHTSPLGFDTDKPLFLDVEVYQDGLRDLSVAKVDLKHIHDKSALGEYESQIDTLLATFKTNIMDAKKQLNEIDEVLFTK